jgi:hypothetical protein
MTTGVLSAIVAITDAITDTKCNTANLPRRFSETFAKIEPLKKTLRT